MPTLYSSYHSHTYSTHTRIHDPFSLPLTVRMSSTCLTQLSLQPGHPYQQRQWYRPRDYHDPDQDYDSDSRNAWRRLTRARRVVDMEDLGRSRTYPGLLPRSPSPPPPRPQREATLEKQNQHRSYSPASWITLRGTVFLMKPCPRLCIQGFLGGLCLSAAILQGCKLWSANECRTGALTGYHHYCATAKASVVATYLTAFLWISWLGWWFYKMVYEVSKRGLDGKDAQGGVQRGRDRHEHAVQQSHSEETDDGQIEVMIPMPGENPSDAVNMRQVGNPSRSSQEKPAPTHPQLTENLQQRSASNTAGNTTLSIDFLDRGHSNSSSSLGLGIDICTTIFIDDIGNLLDSSENKSGDNGDSDSAAISNSSGSQNTSSRSTSPGSSASKSLVCADAVASVPRHSTLARNHPHSVSLGAIGATDLTNTTGRSRSNSTCTDNKQIDQSIITAPAPAATASAAVASTITTPGSVITPRSSQKLVAVAVAFTISIAAEIRLSCLQVRAISCPIRPDL
ncbi:MAG: hypothetical protein J3Q66DRAFT_161745 [Benniella sp.]|nr:MAG: hypothetical protein J3Q66DRAFT_161745 [Benniella sp.]